MILFFPFMKLKRNIVWVIAWDIVKLWTWTTTVTNKKLNNCPRREEQTAVAKRVKHLGSFWWGSESQGCCYWFMSGSWPASSTNFCLSKSPQGNRRFCVVGNESPRKTIKKKTTRGVFWIVLTVPHILPPHRLDNYYRQSINKVIVFVMTNFLKFRNSTLIK